MTYLSLNLYKEKNTSILIINKSFTIQLCYYYNCGSMPTFCVTKMFKHNNFTHSFFITYMNQRNDYLLHHSKRKRLGLHNDTYCCDIKNKINFWYIGNIQKDHHPAFYQSANNYITLWLHSCSHWGAMRTGKGPLHSHKLGKDENECQIKK